VPALGSLLQELRSLTDVSVARPTRQFPNFPIGDGNWTVSGSDHFSDLGRHAVTGTTVHVLDNSECNGVTKVCEGMFGGMYDALGWDNERGGFTKPSVDATGLKVGVGLTLTALGGVEAMAAASGLTFLGGFIGGTTLTPFIVGDGVMAGGPAATTTLYRAVSFAEHDDLMATGRFAQGPNSLGGKWFAESVDHADQWGELLEGAGNFRIISAELPTNVADQMMRVEKLDQIGPARYGELEQLLNAIIGTVR
jgi:hypothetical protein